MAGERGGTEVNEGQKAVRYHRAGGLSRFAAQKLVSIVILGETLPQTLAVARTTSRGAK
jgi:hypothetical protein